MVEQGSGRLGAARVMGADEQHLGDVGHYHFLLLCSARELGGLFDADRTVMGRIDGHGQDGADGAAEAAAWARP
jgi:hypothetical protein